MSRLEELIRELCPDGVEYKKLSAVCKIYDGTHSTPQYTNDGVKFVSVQNINSLYETNKFISESDFKKFKIIPQIGDVFMTRIGSIGVCAVIERNESLAYYVSLALLRPDTEVVSGRYLKYIIESSYGRNELKKRTHVHAVPIIINKDDIGKIFIPVPPLAVQREIVRILDSFTELTAELTARKKQYEYYRDSLLNFDLTYDLSNILGLSELGKMLRELCPEGVAYKKLGEMAIVVRGASPRPIKNFITTDTNGVNWIKIGDITPGSKYITKTTEKITENGAKESRFVHEGDFILSNSMSFGRPYIMKIQGCIHDGWLAISKFEDYFISDFLYYLLVSYKYQHIMKQKASFGGAVQNLNADIVRGLTLPLPPLAVQRG